MEKTNCFISHDDESKAGEALVLSNRLSVVICTWSSGSGNRWALLQSHRKNIT